MLAMIDARYRAPKRLVILNDCDHTRTFTI
jgi:hypothetical protein